MTQQAGPRMIVQDIEQSFFKKFSSISGEGFELKLKNYFRLVESKTPGYEFGIEVGGEDAGSCSVLIDSDFTNVAEYGSFGMELKRKFFGKQLPSKVIKATYVIFRGHGQKSILITHDVGNHAVEKVCDELGGDHIDSYKSSDGKISKNRFIVKIPD